VQLASTADSILQEIFDMIEDLALTLPRLKCCEHTISMGADMELVLLALYREFICFYARTIRLLRDSRHCKYRVLKLTHDSKLNLQAFLLRSSWPTIRADFRRTIQRAKRLSSDIEREVDVCRMQLVNQKYRVVLDFMAELKTQSSKNVNQVTHYLPLAECSHFYGRDDILRLIDEALFVSPSTRSLRSFALYGMGGVGKTQIALKYANASREKFDVILWISAENPVTIWQSFRRISKILDLIEPDTELNDHAIIVKVKDWLSAASKPMDTRPGGDIES
jgi:hypothetical protein